MVNVKTLPRDSAGRIAVYDVALDKMVMVQPVDAREGMERGQFLLDAPAKGGAAKTAEVLSAPQRPDPQAGPQRRKNSD